MESKHSLGKWELEYDGSLVINEQIVASMPHGRIAPDYASKEEALANHTLIAAAPELLEVLNSTLTHLERYAEIIPDGKKWDGHAQSLDNHFSKVREVIKKATE